MTQQRQRRFSSLKSTTKVSSPQQTELLTTENKSKEGKMEESNNPSLNILEEAPSGDESENQQEIEEEENEAEDFDSQSITPGSHCFSCSKERNCIYASTYRPLSLLHHDENAKRPSLEKIKCCIFWCRGIPRILGSEAKVPGEGEHKIMDFIRNLQRDKKNYKENETHCMYGMDADLIMLGILFSSHF